MPSAHRDDTREQGLSAPDAASAYQSLQPVPRTRLARRAIIWDRGLFALDAGRA